MLKRGWRLLRTTKSKQLIRGSMLSWHEFWSSLPPPIGMFAFQTELDNLRDDIDGIFATHVVAPQAPPLAFRYNTIMGTLFSDDDAGMMPESK